MTATRIDVHMHFVPEFYRAALIAAGHATPDGMPGIPAATCEVLAAKLDTTELLDPRLRAAIMRGNSQRLFPNRRFALDG
jgi:hypothetical protein